MSAEQMQRRLQPMTEANADTLVLHEIYRSIQGESSYAGLPCVFVRTTACSLRCTYCDTRHAFTEGRPWSLADTLVEVRRLAQLPRDSPSPHPGARGLGAVGVGSAGPWPARESNQDVNRLVEVTGGEPLLQPAVPRLLTALCDAGHTVLLETSGSLDIGGVDPRVVRIVDLKTPSSGEERANLYSNIEKLTARDEVKFVIGSHADYLWSREMLERYDLARRCGVLMGPVWGAIEARDLAEWIVRDALPVRMQVQLHKVLWGAETRGV